jgi:integrase/recombinase XerD
MTTLAPILQSFFTDKLARQRQASPRTVTAYRDALRLLVQFASLRTPDIGRSFMQGLGGI